MIKVSSYRLGEKADEILSLTMFINIMVLATGTCVSCFLTFHVSIFYNEAKVTKFCDDFQ